MDPVVAALHAPTTLPNPDPQFAAWLARAQGTAHRVVILAPPGHRPHASPVGVRPVLCVRATDVYAGADSAAHPFAADEVW